MDGWSVSVGLENGVPAQRGGGRRCKCVAMCKFTHTNTLIVQCPQNTYLVGLLDVGLAAQGYQLLLQTEHTTVGLQINCILIVHSDA